MISLGPLETDRYQAVSFVCCQQGFAMLITQPALLCLQAVFRSIGRSNAADARTASSAHEHAVPVESRILPPIPVLIDAPPTVPSQFSIQPEVETPSVVGSTDGPLSVRERRARAAALRALALSRTRRFSGARDAFIEASTLDPLLDLTRVPMFWSLERAAHEAAIDAYQMTGREAEATVLRAQVRTTYRPRPLSSSPRVATASP